MYFPTQREARFTGNTEGARLISRNKFTSPVSRTSMTQSYFRFDSFDTGRQKLPQIVLSL